MMAPGKRRNKPELPIAPPPSLAQTSASILFRTRTLDRKGRCPMATTTRRTDPALWERIKAKVTRGSKGGRAGQWSARKAQLAVQDYKKAGGGFIGARSSRNHLVKW